MPYDLFISYSRRDNAEGRITQLVERIKTNFANFEGNNGRELVPFFDQQEIHGREDWLQKIHRGLRESRLLLACFSPAYLDSKFCEMEFVEYLKYEIGHLNGSNGVAPVYFVEVPGWDDKDFDQKCAAWVAELRRRQNFDLRPWFDQGEEALHEAAVKERMEKLNRSIVEAITHGERAEKSLGNVDAPNPHFIGRGINMRMLRDNFSKREKIGVVTAVNGVGGLGKTALAIQYAHTYADEYGGGRWQVRCAGKDDLRLALAELATSIGFEFTDDEKKNADLQFERTRRELKKLADAREPHRCLLLLDNVDQPGLLDPAQVARLNGGDWLHILATTRLGENELHGAHRDRSFLAIDELPPDDALALIESYQPDGRFRSEAERDAAREIVRLLGSFTLAVESAAVYLGQFANDVTCAAFLARLKKEGLEGLDSAASQSDVGGRVLSWGDKTLRLWDNQSGICLGILEGNTEFVTGALELLNGRVASWSHDGTLRLWNLSNFTFLAALDGNGSPILGVVPIGERLLSWSRGGTFLLSDLHNGKCLDAAPRNEAERARPEWIHARRKAVYPSRVVLDFFLASSAHTAHLKHTNSSIAITTWQAETDTIARCLLPDGTAVVTQDDGQVCVLKLHHGNRSVSLAEAEDILTSQHKLAK